MRIVLLGTNSLALATARLLIDHGHEVIVIEPDAARVEKLTEELDCSFVTGDGSRPAILKEVGPKNTDFLFCLTENDQENIIAALVGRTLGFGRVVTSIKDTDYGPVCTELGLDDAVFLDQSLAHALSDMVAGVERASLSAAVLGGLRFLAFSVDDRQAGKLADLHMPESARVVAVTRAGNSWLAADDMRLEVGDEILFVAEADSIDAVRDVFRRDDENGKDATG